MTRWGRPGRPGSGRLPPSGATCRWRRSTSTRPITGLVGRVALTQSFVNRARRSRWRRPTSSRCPTGPPSPACTMTADGRVIEARAQGARPGAGRRTTAAIEAGPARRHRRGGAAGRLHHAGRQHPAGRAGHGRADAGRAAALRGRRGDVPVPAGGRAALHPGVAAGRRAGRRRARARHRRRARRLPDHAPGAAARLPQPGAACRSASTSTRPGSPLGESGPACTRSSSEERRRQAGQSRAGRAGRPRLHPPRLGPARRTVGHGRDRRRGRRGRARARSR